MVTVSELSLVSLAACRHCVYLVFRDPNSPSERHGGCVKQPSSIKLQVQTAD